jgi:hypothetical protein
LNRYQADALIDLGKSDGITSGQIFDVLPKESVTVKNEGIGIDYDPANIWGTFTVTTVDEDMSQGTLKRNGFYDRMNAGDTVVLKPKGAEKPAAGNDAVINASPALLSLLRKIR